MAVLEISDNWYSNRHLGIDLLNFFYHKLVHTDVLLLQLNLSFKQYLGAYFTGFTGLTDNRLG